MRGSQTLTDQTHFFAKWVAAEAVDSDLSIIDTEMTSDITGTSQIRFVPRGAHVTGLTTSSTVLCTKNPICIIAVVVGDVSLADKEA